MIEFTFRALTSWPGALRSDHQRQFSPFKASYPDTVDLLKREVETLDGKHAVIEAAFRERDIRNDGMIRAGAPLPPHPGVIVSFESRYGPLRYFTDVFRGRYNTPGWQANLRAIALGLEALRKVDRYGITRRGEQYTGWKQLPSGVAGSAGVDDTPMTFDEAVELLLEWSRDSRDVARFDYDDIASGTWVREAFRGAALRAHPDMGGDAEVFPRLVHARDLIIETIGSWDD